MFTPGSFTVLLFRKAGKVFSPSLTASTEHRPLTPIERGLSGGEG